MEHPENQYRPITPDEEDIMRIYEVEIVFWTWLRKPKVYIQKDLVLEMEEAAFYKHLPITQSWNLVQDSVPSPDPAGIPIESVNRSAKEIWELMWNNYRL